MNKEIDWAAETEKLKNRVPDDIYRKIVEAGIKWIIEVNKFDDLQLKELIELMRDTETLTEVDRKGGG